MADTLAPGATPHLPPYVAIPGQTDTLFVIVVVFVLLLILGLGIFYFRLHALPEQLAHKGERTHMQLVAILALIALFTHNNLFWIAALLLAAIEFPNYERYFRSISRSLERLAGRTEAPDEADPGTDADDAESMAAAQEPTATGSTAHGIARELAAKEG